MPTTTPTAPALKCRRCGNTKLTVETGQQHRKRGDEQVTVVNVRCPRRKKGCGNSWWSRARRALDTAKAADRAEKGARP